MRTHRNHSLEIARFAMARQLPLKSFTDLPLRGELMLGCLQVHRPLRELRRRRRRRQLLLQRVAGC